VSELKTPVQDFISAVKTALTSYADLTGVTIYDHWLPKAGAKLPAISIVEVAAIMQQEAGIGEQLSATEKGVYIKIMLQLDFWARTALTVRQMADAARYCLWINRASFGDKAPKGIEVSADVWRFAESEQIKEELYRKQLNVQAVYAMTKNV